MDQAQKAGVATAVLLLAVAAGVALYYGVMATGRRQWRALDSKSKLLLVVGFVGWIAWVASSKVLRPWSATFGIDGYWVLGVLPSFIAGIAVTAYAAFVLAVTHRHSSLTAFLLGAAIVLALELVQFWLPSRVFDPFDVLAGTCGSALMAFILFVLASRASAKSSTRRSS